MKKPTPGPLVIRPAVPGDVPQILRFIRELAAYERLANRVIADETTLRDSLFGPQPAAEVALAETGGQPVGFAVYFHNFSTFVGRPGIYLEDLFVLPEARGRGVGRALLRHLAALAVERRCGRLEWAVLDWNESAIGFYRGLGAAAMDGWTVYRLEGEPLARLAGRPAPRSSNRQGRRSADPSNSA